MQSKVPWGVGRTHFGSVFFKKTDHDLELRMLMSSLFHSAIVEQNIRKKLFCFENNTIHFPKKRENNTFSKKKLFCFGECYENILYDQLKFSCGIKIRIIKSRILAKHFNKLKGVVTCKRKDLETVNWRKNSWTSWKVEE